MSKWDQFEWYNKADCFIGASRGEGFGLMPLQAMALGIPTIITATSGQAQYADLASAVIPTTPKRCDVHEITNFAGFWDEPDLDALVEALRKVYKGSDVYKYKAMFHVKHVAEYSWARSCKKLLAVLPKGDILDDPISEPFVCHIKTKGHGAWLDTMNSNRANHYVECENLKALVSDQRKIITEMSIKNAQLEKSLLDANHTIDYLSKRQMTLSSKKFD
jgi:hypothetical protein